MLHKFLTLRGLLGGTGGSTSDDPTIILVDEAGTEVTAVLVDEETVLDATENDIRSGKVAATESGVTTGTKEIPAYHTTEGIQLVPSGSELKITTLSDGDRYDYTKFQAIVCPYNTSVADSVASEKVVIEDNVYATQNVDVLATISKDSDAKTVVFGITNTGTVPCLIRYMTYKEEY